MRARGLTAALVLAAATIGCGPTVDLKTGLQIVDVSSGWVDAGIVNGQNKLVPSISFKLKNVSDQRLSVLQVNLRFRRVNEEEEWGNRYLSVTGSEGLAPGATTQTVTADSSQGYTGTEPRLDMLKNSNFVDAKAEISAKYGSIQWQRLSEYPIARRLIAR
jgi:hypothetical protein